MASNLINKYVWLVDTIYRKRKISFEELNCLWQDNDISEGAELSKRTFHKWRVAVEELFGLVIENENKGEYRYFIQNESAVSSGGLRSWILNTLTVSNLLQGCKGIKDRIMFEDIPSGQQYLSPIIEAMKENRMLSMTYKGYYSCEPSTYVVEPYCVKLFKQRWYMVARKTDTGGMRIYSLDRIISLHKENDRFAYPKDFDPEEFFYGCFGVIACDGTKVETVELQVTEDQANYIRSLPLHESQKEIYRCEAYSVFRYSVRPTYDFMQEVLSHGADVEVLAPIWFRQQVADVAGDMWKIYKGGNNDKKQEEKS